MEQWTDPVSGAFFERQTFNALVSPFDLADTYTPAFKAAISQARAAGVMYSANALNGVPLCVDAAADALLDSWVAPGAPFYRATDGGQIGNAVAGHHYVKTLDAAIGEAAAAESDIADGSEYATRLTQAICNGNVSLAAARRLLRNTLRVRMALGLFDKAEGQPYLGYGEAHIATARANESVAIAAREGLVLQKNERGTLPFAPAPAAAAAAAAGGARGAAGVASLAVVGPCADDMLLLGGNYLGAVCPNGPHGPADDCHPSILRALTAAYAPDALYAPGGGYNSTSPPEIAAAVAAVRGAARAVLCLGIDKTFEREQLDRTEIGLPGAQAALFAAVEAAAAAAGTPLAVVLVHGGALSVPAVAASAAAGALLDALQPGCAAGGKAVADALFGAFSPGGKLPYTIPFPNWTQVSNFTDMGVAVPRGGPGVGRTYRYSREPPLYAFGFGLSYTNFSLAWAAPAPPASATLNATGALLLRVEVRNTGAAAGGEVAQAYFSPREGTFGAAEPPFLPLRQLWAFQRTRVLGPGEAQVVEWALTAEQLALTGEGGARAVLRGVFDISVGRGHGEVLGFTVTVA